MRRLQVTRMIRISSQTDFFYKYFFPLIWVSGLLSFSLFCLFAKFVDPMDKTLMTLFPLGILAVGIWPIRKALKFADEVYLDDMHLLVKKCMRTRTIPLSRIQTVKVQTNPLRTATVRISLGETEELLFNVSKLWVHDSKLKDSCFSGDFRELLKKTLPTAKIYLNGEIQNQI